MRVYHYRLLFLFLLTPSSCSKEEISPLPTMKQPQGIGILQRIQTFDLGDLDNPVNISEYEYAENDKLWKIEDINPSDSSIISYKLHFYNDNGNCIRTEAHHANKYEPSGYILLEINIFEYTESSQLKRKQIIYPHVEITSLETYEYDAHGFLIKISIWDDEEVLENYTIIENDPFGNVLKESLYGPNDILYYTRLHQYENNHLVKSDEYKIDDEQIHLRENTRKYDSQSNLIQLTVREIWEYSSMRSHTRIYEYKP